MNYRSFFLCIVVITYSSALLATDHQEPLHNNHPLAVAESNIQQENNGNQDDHSNKIGSTTETAGAVATPPPPEFIPTEDWQIIQPGQAIPPGLHVRVDMTTGVKMARKMADGEVIDRFHPHSDNNHQDSQDNMQPNDEEVLPLPAPEDVPKDEVNLSSIKDLSKEEFDELYRILFEPTLTKPVEIMKQQLAIVRDSQSATEQVDALTEIEDLCHQYDDAVDFITIGGMIDLISLLNRSETSANVLAAASFVIGSCCQNNPEVQTHAMENGVITALTTVLSRSSGFTEEARAPSTSSFNEQFLQRKILYALASILRSNGPAQQSFSGLDGGRLLLHLVKTGLIIDDPMALPYPPIVSHSVAKKAFSLVQDLLSDQIINAQSGDQAQWDSSRESARHQKASIPLVNGTAGEMEITNELTPVHQSRNVSSSLLFDSLITDEWCQLYLLLLNKTTEGDESFLEEIIQTFDILTKPYFNKNLSLQDYSHGFCNKQINPLQTIRKLSELIQNLRQKSSNEEDYLWNDILTTAETVVTRLQSYEKAAS